MAPMGIVKLLMLVVWCMLSCYIVGGSSMTIDEELELDRELKILNKPPVKTFQEKEGDIIDCIDIYKQPAFDHPLLKNHKIQMRPSPHIERLINETLSSSTAPNAKEVGSKQFDCPKGTVPIRRTSKEDLIRAKSFSELLFNRSSIHPLDLADEPGKHLAILQSSDSTPYPFYGLLGHMKLDKPLVVGNQFSSSQMWLEGGPPNDVNSIQAGWAVAPSLFVDDRPRYFSYWSSKVGGTTSGCFNLLCPGFVQVARQQALGVFIDPISVYGADTFRYVKVLIFQDPETLRWWLNLDGENVGYWPKEIVPWLSRGAKYVAWGGQASSPPNSPLGSPQMGNGYFPNNVMSKTSMHFFLHYLNLTNGLVHVPDDMAGFNFHTDSPGCFELQKMALQNFVFKFTFLFGGTGGAKCQGKIKLQFRLA